MVLSSQIEMCNEVERLLFLRKYDHQTYGPPLTAVFQMYPTKLKDFNSSLSTVAAALGCNQSRY